MALTVLGDLAAARATLSESLRLATDTGDTWGEMAAQADLGRVLLSLGSLAAAEAACRAALRIGEARANEEPGDPQRQRDLSVSHGRIGDVLVAQGDGPQALSAYRKGLAIREALAARDPANALWQTDLAVSRSRLGTLEHGQDADERRALLARGRDILLRLRCAGRLLPSRDWIGWFDERLAASPRDET